MYDPTSAYSPIQNLQQLSQQKSNQVAIAGGISILQSILCLLAQIEVSHCPQQALSSQSAPSSHVLSYRKSNRKTKFELGFESGSKLGVAECSPNSRQWVETSSTCVWGIGRMNLQMASSFDGSSAVNLIQLVSMLVTRTGTNKLRLRSKENEGSSSSSHREVEQDRWRRRSSTQFPAVTHHLHWVENRGKWGSHFPKLNPSHFPNPVPKHGKWYPTLPVSSTQPSFPCIQTPPKGVRFHDLESSSWLHALAPIKALEVVPAAWIKLKIFLSLRGSRWGPPFIVEPESTSRIKALRVSYFLLENTIRWDVKAWIFWSTAWEWAA